jgi:phosphatidylserine decarboxylase
MDPLFIIVFFVSIALLFASAVKWSLPVNKYFLIILSSTVLSLIISFILNYLETNSLIVSIVFLFSQFIFYAGILLFLFFRDPERIPPAITNALVSPADGTVIYINKIPKGELLQSEKKGSILIYDELRGTNLSKSELWQIGISLLFTDVHINRSPISGQVNLLNHRPGKFLSLRHEDAVNVNERQTIVIENKSITIGLVQIASRLVRRIESYISEKEQIKIGQKIGMIKFGSQVDIFVPVERVPDIKIKVGEYIIAGETLIGLIN